MARYGHSIAEIFAGTPIDEYVKTKAMTTAFFTLSICEICKAFTLRSLKNSIFTMKKQNFVLWGALAFSLAATLAVIYIPPVAEVFDLMPLTFREIIIAFGLAVIVIPVIEIVKAIQRRVGKRKLA
jgi:Ca2+-transporting ATPase